MLDDYSALDSGIFRERNSRREKTRASAGIPRSARLLYGYQRFCSICFLFSPKLKRSNANSDLFLYSAETGPLVQDDVFQNRISRELNRISPSRESAQQIFAKSLARCRGAWCCTVPGFEPRAGDGTTQALSAFRILADSRAKKALITSRASAELSFTDGCHGCHLGPTNLGPQA